MSNSIFKKVSRPKVKRSTFNLSEETKLSMNMGDLVPICCKEVLPGDKFEISTELLIKFAPLAAPVMHRIKAYVHYFFVPTEQIYSHWGDFINPKVNVNNDILLPVVSTYDLDRKKGSLSDYFGLPILREKWWTDSHRISALPFLAYQHIYNEYYRDENLEPLTANNDISILRNNQGKFSAEVSSEISKLRKRAWAKDYFTSALPSPQAGDDVLVPFDGDISPNGPFTMNSAAHYSSNEELLIWGAQQNPERRGLLFHQSQQPGGSVTFNPVSYSSGLKIQNARATINDLRKALALQRFKELAERGGTRYSEMVRNFFDTYLPDWYVDRPIFLGGSTQPINIGEVVQTSSNNTTTEQSLGQRGGIASSYGKSKTATLKAPCHGFLMGILSIRPVASYQDGLERMWTRDNIFDYPFPQFANLGEQEILNKELFVGGANDDGVFGYTPRYAEWKEGHCHVCGEFRDSLSYWHFGRKFSKTPTLNKNFVMMESVSTDPFVVVDGQTEHIYVNLYNDIRAKRPLPFFGTPSII